MKPVLRISIKDYSPPKLLLILLISGTLPAQAATPSPTVRTTTESKSPITKALVLRGGTIFDSQRGFMLSDQTIIIRGERIEQVSPRPYLKLQEGFASRGISAKGAPALGRPWETI